MAVHDHTINRARMHILQFSVHAMQLLCVCHAIKFINEYVHVIASYPKYFDKYAELIRPIYLGVTFIIGFFWAVAVVQAGALGLRCFAWS